MSGQCKSCGKKLGFLDRVTGISLCASCAKKEKEEIQEARSEYPIILREIFNRVRGLEEGIEELSRVETTAKINEKEKKQVIDKAFRNYAEEILADDILTEKEEQQLLETASRLGITQEIISNQFRDILLRLFVARVNDGRIPILQSSKIILKNEECAHLEMAAN